MAKIIYKDESKPLVIEVGDENQTLLELSMANHIAHYQECGGVVQCTTCRVAILSGIEHVSTRNAKEQRLAKLRNWGDPIRLACQTKVKGDVALRRVLFPIQFQADKVKLPAREQAVVVMVCDIRSFTRFTTTQLPYDIVHILNDYFEGKDIPQTVHELIGLRSTLEIGS